MYRTADLAPPSHVWRAMTPQPNTAAVVQPGGVLLAPAYVLELAAAGAYATIPAISAYDVGTGDFTIEAWFRSAQGGPLVTLAAGSVTVFQIALLANGDIALVEGGQTVLSISQPSIALDGEWHQISVTRAAGVLTVYLDGIAQASGAEVTRFSINGVSQLLLGSAPGGASTLIGNYADVRFWNVALSQAQILADRVFRVEATPGLIGYWTFVAQSLVDSSANGNNGGALAGGAGYRFMPIAHQPKIGTLLLDGETPFVAIGGTADYNFGRGDLTVEAWVAPRTAGPMIRRGVASNGAAGFVIGADPDGSLWAIMSDGVTTQTVRTTTPIAGLIGGRAHHIALVRQSTRATLYVDGSPVGGASSAAVSIDVPLSVPLQLGNAQSTLIGPASRPPRSPSGPPPPPAAVVTYGLALSELRIWSSARSQDQIYRLMMIESHGDELGLVGYWNFATGNVIDRSSRRNLAVSPYTVSVVENRLGLALAQYVLSLPGGTTGYMAVPSSKGFDFGAGDFTIELQFASSAPGTLLCRAPERTSPSCGYTVAVTATALTLTLDDGANPQVFTAPATLLDNQWHHIAWRRTAGVISAFVDASLVTASPTASTQNLVAPTPLVVGAAYNAATNLYSAALVGRIDFVTLWPVALALADLQRTTYRAVSETLVGAAGAWSFDQQAPIDQSLAGNNGMLGTGASIVAENGLDATVPLSSLAFSGQASLMDASPRADLSFGGAAPYTVAAWVCPSAAGATGTIASRFDTAGSGSEWRLRLVGGVAVAERATTGGTVSGVTRLLPGQWYFVSMSYDGAILSVAVNGNPEGKAAIGAVTAAPATRALIGASAAGAGVADSFAGAIQTALIWSQALTPSALFGAVRSTVTGTEAGLQAAFSFEYGTTRDWTGHGPAGVATGAIFQAVTFADQPIHLARSLSGEGGGYIDCGGGRSLTVDAAMTLEAWVRIDAFTAPDQPIMAKGSVYQIRRSGTTNQISFSTAGLQPAAAAELVSTASVNLLDGNWHHLCATYDGAVKSLYIDGVLNASIAATGSLSRGNGLLYFADNDGEILILDQETGDEIWTARTFDPIAVSPVVDKNILCVSSPNGNIFGFDTEQQTRLWDTQIPMNFQVPLRIHRDQVLYSGASTAISALDLLTGAPAWSLRGIANNAPPTIVDTTALFCAQYTVFSRDIVTTKLNWAYNLPDKALAAPAVEQGYAFVNCGDNNIYALSIDGVVGRSGSYQASAALLGAPLIDSNVIYIASADGTITALNYGAGSFNMIWSVAMGTTLAQPIVVGAPFVTAVGADNVLRVYNALTGAPVWTWARAAGGVNLAITGLTVLNGAAYLSLSSGAYLALDIINQRILWEKDIQTVAVAGAAITYAPFCIGASVSAKGVLAAASFDGLVAEVRLWSEARSATEIAQTFNRRIVGDEVGLAGYWACSSTAMIEQDLSGNLNPGRIVGAAPTTEVYFGLRAPPPRLLAQARMMQDWSGADIAVDNRDGTVVFRTEISFLNGNASPLQGAEVRLWTDEPATIVANGVTYTTDNANAAIVTSDARGMVTVITPCTALTSPTLQLWADYMVEDERVIIHPDANLTDTLGTISGADIINPQASSNPLLKDKTTLFPSLTQAQADGIASAINNAIQTVKQPNVSAKARRVSLEAMISGLSAAPGSGGAVSRDIVLDGKSQYARTVGPGSIPHWKFDFATYAFTPMTQAEVDAHVTRCAPEALVSTETLVGASLWDDFVNGLKQAANFVITVVGDAVQIVVSWVQSGIQALTHVFQSVADVGRALFGIFKQLLDTIVDAAKKIYRFFAFLFDWDDILVTKDALVRNVKDVFGQVGAKIDWAITQEKAFFDDIESKVDNSFQMLIGQIGKQSLSMINDSAPSLQPMLPGGGGGLNASHAAHRFAVLEQQRGAYGVEGNWLTSTSLANGNGITGGAVAGYDAAAFGALGQVFETIYSMVSDGKAVAAFKNAENCFRQIGNNPQSLLQLIMQGVLEAIRGLADLAIEICKVITTLLLEALKGLFALLLSAMTAAIEIPVVSWLYGKISGGKPLSILDLMALIVAIPTTVVYKAFAGSAPFAPSRAAHAEAILAAAGMTPTQKGFKTAGAIAQLINIPFAIIIDVQAVAEPLLKPFPARLTAHFNRIDAKKMGPSFGPNFLRWMSFGLQAIGYTCNAPWIYSDAAGVSIYDVINWLFGAAEFIVVQGTLAVFASMQGEVWAGSWMLPCVVGTLRLVMWLVSLVIALLGGLALVPAKVASGFFSPLPALAKFLRKRECVVASEGVSLIILGAVDLIAGGIPPAIALGTTWA